MYGQARSSLAFCEQRRCAGIADLKCARALTRRAFIEAKSSSYGITTPSKGLDFRLRAAWMDRLCVVALNSAGDPIYEARSNNRLISRKRICRRPAQITRLSADNRELGF